MLKASGRPISSKVRPLCATYKNVLKNNTTYQNIKGLHP